MRNALLLALACLGAAGSVACSSSSNLGSGGFEAGGSGGSGTAGGSDFGGFGLGGGRQTGAGGDVPSLIYANDDTTLAQLDPTSADLAVTVVGDFDCIDPNGSSDYAMTDIAVNATGDLWGVTGHTIRHLSIVPSTTGTTVVHCDSDVSLQNEDTIFYALTFAPTGTVDPRGEVLVAGNTAGELWKVSATGELEQHGRFGTVPADDGHGYTYPNAGQEWELSGDIAFFAHGGSPVGFATVRDCPSPPSSTGCNDVNTLIEIDMKAITAAGTQSVTKAVRGAIVKRDTSCNDGLSDYGNMYGIAAWGDKVYGFSRLGLLVGIDIADGSACLVQKYPSLPFAGAGVTTVAPIVVPPLH